MNKRKYYENRNQKNNYKDNNKMLINRWVFKISIGTKNEI